MIKKLIKIISKTIEDSDTVGSNHSANALLKAKRHIVRDFLPDLLSFENDVKCEDGFTFKKEFLHRNNSCKSDNVVTKYLPNIFIRFVSLNF